MKRLAIAFAIGMVAVCGISMVTALAGGKATDHRGNAGTRAKGGGMLGHGVDKFGASRSQAPLRPQAQLAIRLRYQGTDIRPHPEARGDELALHQEIARGLSALDLKPEQRMAHFRWCDRPELGCTGWYGTISEVARSPRGWLVDVRVSPRLVSDLGAVTITPDYVIESYEYYGGKLHYLRGIDPPDSSPGCIETY
jgi:hypothetical protein